MGDKQASRTGSRTFHSRTHIEIVDQSENINFTLRSEMSAKLSPKDEATTNPGWTSRDIWSDMPENSYYYMFMDNRNIHFASYALTSNGLSLAKIYRHKKSPSTYADTDISDFFLYANRLTAPPDFLPADWRIKSVNDLFGSFVATYTNGTADAIYSAAENIFPSTTTTASASASTSGLAATDASSFRVRPAVVASTAAGLTAVVASTAGPAVVASTTGPAVVASTTGPAVVASTTGPVVLPAVVASTAGPVVLPAVVVPTTGPAVVAPPAPLAWTSTTLGSSKWSLTSTAMDSSQCAESIEPYNKEFPTKTIACPPVPVAGYDATSKLVVTLVYRTTLPNGLVDVGTVQHSVGMEKKGDTWSGFAAFFAGWIRIDVTGTKMKFTVRTSAGKYEQREVFVKKDPATEKQYTFEGGTVRYTGENPFEITGLSTGAIIGIVIACVVAVLVVGAVIFFATSSSRRDSASAFFRDRRDAIGRWGSTARGAISEKLGRRPRQEGPEVEFEDASYSESDNLPGDLDR